MMCVRSSFVLFLYIVCFCSSHAAFTKSKKYCNRASPLQQSIFPLSARALSRDDFISLGICGVLGVAFRNPSLAHAKIEADPERDPVKYMDEFFHVDKMEKDYDPDSFSWVLNDDERIRSRAKGAIPAERGDKWPHSASPLTSLSDAGASDLEKAIRDSVTVGTIDPLTHGK